MPAPRKTRRLLVLGVMVGVGAVALAMAFAGRPSDPRLVRISSMSVDLDGVMTHVQLQVPEGWMDMLPDTGPDEAYGPPHMTVRIVPFGRRSLVPTWLPTWLRSFITGRREPHAEIEIDVGKQNFDCAEKTRYFTFNQEGMTVYGIERVVDGGVGHRINYLRTNRAEFEATYRQICESFRVVR